MSALTHMPLETALWDLPVATACQIALLHAASQGETFYQTLP